MFLPEIPNKRDASVQRNISLVEGKEGIEKVHVVSKTCTNNHLGIASIGPAVIAPEG